MLGGFWHLTLVCPLLQARRTLAFLVGIIFASSSGSLAAGKDRTAASWRLSRPSNCLTLGYPRPQRGAKPPELFTISHKQTRRGLQGRVV